MEGYLLTLGPIDNIISKIWSLVVCVACKVLILVGFVPTRSPVCWPVVWMVRLLEDAGVQKCRVDARQQHELCTCVYWCM